MQLSRRRLLAGGAGIAGAALLGAAGCSGKSQPSTNSSAINYYWQPALVKAGGYSLNLVQETFGVKFSTVYALTQADYLTKFQAFLAQGEIPDAMAINGPDMLQKFAEQGAFGVVSVDDVRKYAPNFSAGIDKNVPAAWVTTLYNGKNYGFPGIGGPAAGYSSFTAWRTDLLEKAGIGTVPDTLDDYEAAFAAVKKLGVYGMTTNGQSFFSAFMTIFGAHGVLPMQWHLYNGRVTNDAIRPETKEALSLLAGWYKKGYIDPECMGPDPSPKFVAGKVSMWDYSGAADGDPTNQSGRLYAIRQTNRNGKLAFGLPPQGPGGRASWSFGRAGWPVAFSPQVEKDKGKLREVLRMWDTIWKDDDLATKLSIGEQGKMYQVNDDSKGLDGGWKWIGKYVDPSVRGQEGFNGYGAPFIGQPNWDIAMKLAQPDVAQRNEVQTFGKYGRSDIFENPATVPGSGEYTANLQSLKVKAFSQIITGAAPVSSFDDFVKQWNAAGGSQLEKAANQLYEQTHK
jgi:putative aldouronate transport system substrate-binding protein